MALDNRNIALEMKNEIRRAIYMAPIILISLDAHYYYYYTYTEM